MNLFRHGNQLGRKTSRSLHMRDCLDRELSLACCADRGCGRQRGRGLVVALAPGTPQRRLILLVPDNGCVGAHKTWRGRR